MERFYRIIFLALFILGFIGAVASAERTGQNGTSESNFISLLNDVKLVDEANQINAGRWNIESPSMASASLDQIETIFKDDPK